MTQAHLPLARPSSGSALVEFAVVAVVFLSLMLAIIDFGRLLFTLNAAAEATRWGARVAVVCNQLTPDQVRDKMRKILPQLANKNIVITWYNPEGVVDGACDKTSCKGVEVRIYHSDADGDANNFRIATLSPFLDFLLPPVPAFPAYLPRESMEAVNAAGDQNPMCL